MEREQDEKLDARIEERAKHLWEAAGRPSTGVEAYRDEARTLIALEDDPHAGTETLSESLDEGDGEPLEAVENQGEFPTLTDQGEEQTAPKPPKGRD